MANKPKPKVLAMQIHSYKSTSQNFIGYATSNQLELLAFRSRKNRESPIDFKQNSIN